MVETEVHSDPDQNDAVKWLAGVVDSRASVYVHMSENMLGRVSLVLPDKHMYECVVNSLSAFIPCGLPSVRVSKKRHTASYILNFSSTRGTQLLKLVIPYMKNTQLLLKAKDYIEIFHPDSKNKKIPNERFRGLQKWNQFQRKT